jgi:O-antigen ligase
MDLFLSNQLRDYQGENSFSWRVNLWIASFPMILQSPIWGHGLSSFLPLSVKFFDSPQGVGAHNVYIELLFETGLLGLLSYLAIFAGILNRLWKTIKRSTGEMNKKYFLVLAYVISYLIINISDNMLFYLAFNWYFWFFIGLVMASIRLEEQKA